MRRLRTAAVIAAGCLGSGCLTAIPSVGRAMFDPNGEWELVRTTTELQQAWAAPRRTSVRLLDEDTSFRVAADLAVQGGS